MPKFHSSLMVNYTPEQMFALVMDVKKYPLFLPLCEALVVKSHKERDGKVLLIAAMTVGYKAIRETFTSQVLANAEAKVIDVQYLDGPFKYLHNKWTFIAIDGGGCKVGFDIDYEFKNRILGALMGSMFDIAFRRFSQAFEERAALVYGIHSSQNMDT